MFNTLAKFAAAVKEAKRKQLKIREDKVRGKADSSRYQIRRRPSPASHTPRAAVLPLPKQRMDEIKKKSAKR